MQLIAFEGIDGSGKSTLIEFMEKALVRGGYKVKVVKFPQYSTPIGKLIRDYLDWKEELNEEVFHMLFELDRLNFDHNIDILEKEGYDYVLFDRHLLSNLAYIKAKGDIDSQAVLKISERYRLPDKYIVLDIPVEESARRRPDGRDMHETDLEFLDTVRETYREFSVSMDNVHLIDGNYPTTALAMQVLMLLNV